MLITGLIMLGVSIIGGIIAVVAFAFSTVSSLENFDDSTHTISEHVTVDGLGDNRWYIYQDPADRTATCSVTDPQGNDIVERSSDMQLSTTEISLEAFQSFTSTADATYEIQCSEYPVVLGGAIPFGGVIGLVISMVGALILSMAGVILTIIGALRRRSHKRSQAQPIGGNYPPPGYQGHGYPPQPPYPPHQPGQYPPSA